MRKLFVGAVFVAMVLVAPGATGARADTAMAPPGGWPDTCSQTAPCIYTPPPPVTCTANTPCWSYKNYGNVYMPLNTDAAVWVSNNYNQACFTEAELLNIFGGAVAEQKYDSGYCNTAWYTGYGTYGGSEQSVEVVDSAGHSGPIICSNGNGGICVTSYHNWFANAIPNDTVGYGLIQETMENPVGDPTHFILITGKYGPSE